VGYYHGEARSDAAAGGGSSGSALDLVHPVGRRIAERIAERQPGGEGFLLALDNAKLAAFSRQGSSEPPLELLLREPSAPAGSKGGWRRAPAAAAGSSGGLVLSSGGSSWEALRLRFLNAHAKGLHGRLSDFDDHLDDVSRDYSNAGLLASAGDMLSR
jgi:hypothetical protein